MAPRPVRSLIVIPLLLALTGVVLSLSAAQAGEGAETFVTMIGEPGAHVGGSQHQFFHPGNASLSLSGTASYVTVRVEGGNFGNNYHFEFAAPPGELLRIGEYEGAQRAAFRDEGRPGLEIFG